MKKSIYFFTVLISLALFTGCSSDNDSTNSNNETYQKLLGKWYFDDPIANPIANNSFTFVSNGNVTYSYWTGVDNEYDSETGTFTVQNNILTMVFPETVSITFVQEVVFINNKVVQFIQAEGSNEEPYDGTYYKL